MGGVVISFPLLSPLSQVFIKVMKKWREVRQTVNRAPVDARRIWRSVHLVFPRAAVHHPTSVRRPCGGRYKGCRIYCPLYRWASALCCAFIYCVISSFLVPFYAMCVLFHCTTCPFSSLSVWYVTFPHQ